MSAPIAKGFPAFRFNLSDNCVRLTLTFAMVNGNECALFRESQSNRFTNASTCARNQGDFVL